MLQLMVILDDRAARSFAGVMSVTFIGTAGMLFYAFVKKHLTLAEFEDAVEALSQTVWLARAVVADLIEESSGGQAMKKEQMVGTRLPETVVRDLEAIEQVEQSDRSTTVRKLLSRAIQDWKLEHYS